MARQLTLIEHEHPWQLDEHTKEVGRRGLAEARAALAAHKPADEQRRHAA
jgi:hypothetical protein